MMWIIKRRMWDIGLRDEPFRSIPVSLLLISCLSLIMNFGCEGISLARLKDPGVSEESIIRAWKEFSRKGKKAVATGEYPYIACFQRASMKHDVPLPLLLAVARGESNFDPNASSNKGCLGVMQIQWPGTARDLGITRKSDLLDPCINIDAGARYLSWLLKRFEGNPYLAVAGYNYGPNAVSPGRVPEGATWYAAYIHRHLQAVLSLPFQKKDRVLILEFTYYRSALDFADYLKRAVKDLPVEIFKSRKYTYDVYLTYKTAGKRERHLQRLMEKTGMKPMFGG